jgi:NADPH:quinone reductase-like Zn-dependent oxidoreductase
MQAVTLAAYGSAERLTVSHYPDPKLGDRDVIVRMAGASINPIDWKLRSGAMKAMMPLVFPAILGRDASGEVVEVGSHVSRLKVGTRVMGLVEGSYAELLVAPADAWAEVPAKLDLVDAAALPLILLTGAQLIEDIVRVRQGDVVLVTGAVGSVGRTAVFVAKSLGAQVWAGVRGKQLPEAEKLGAFGTVALDDDADVAKLPMLDSIADTVGGRALERAMGRLKPGGTIGSVVGEPVGAKERGFLVRAGFTRPDCAKLRALAQAVADNQLVIPIAKRFPLAEAQKAQEMAEHHAGGKVILVGPSRDREALRPKAPPLPFQRA